MHFIFALKDYDELGEKSVSQWSYFGMEPSIYYVPSRKVNVLGQGCFVKPRYWMRKALCCKLRMSKTLRSFVEVLHAWDVSLARDSVLVKFF